MKKWIGVTLVCAWLAIVGGCHSPAANIGLGTGIGAALSQTISGAKADLEQREQQLIELYNQGVEAGMEKEKLDEIEQAIIDTRLGKQTVETGEHLLGIDWSDPKQTGGAIGLISSIALLWFKRKELIKTKSELVGKSDAIAKFCGTHEPTVAGELHDIVKENTRNS